MSQHGEDVRVPYAPEFTPATLGKEIGEDKVLAWLLQAIETAAGRAALQDRIVEGCLQHVSPGKSEETRRKNQRDMASHVVQALRNYGLMEEGEGASLTSVGHQILDAEDEERPILFARHILTSCNGMRLVEAVKIRQLRGEKILLEDLAEELDDHRTGKSVSSMRVWLAQAGVFERRGYRLNDEGLEAVLGTSTAKLYGLSRAELEFVLAVRLLTLMEGQQVVEAPDAAELAERRNSAVRIRRKSLGGFVDALVKRGIVDGGVAPGRGGARRTVRLTSQWQELADDQIRGLLDQTQSGFELSELRPLDEVISQIAEGDADRLGRFGEMLAVHACLMLGLRVVAWRKRTPVELDLIAERTASLSYQRWDVQVKNTLGDLDADRVDREIGAVAGTGVTHILFVVPRAGVTATAQREILQTVRLTNLHIYVLTRESFGSEMSGVALLGSLRRQVTDLARVKRAEAERREDG